MCFLMSFILVSTCSEINAVINGCNSDVMYFPIKVDCHVSYAISYFASQSDVLKFLSG